MESNRLRLLFSRALRASLASPLVLTGCDGGEVDLTGYVEPACENRNLAVTGLLPVTTPEFIALRAFAPMDESAESKWRVSSTGTPCATATQPDVCQSALESLAPTPGFRDACGVLCTDYFLATTRGDTVSAIASLEALKAFLGPIDTTQEAALTAFASGYDIGCGNGLNHGAVKDLGDGTFGVVGTQGMACGKGTELTRHVLRVTSTGEVVEEERTVLERGSDNCAVGRRPEGLQSPGAVACDDVLGRHFATIAHLEAASIQAFLRLREELALHGADVALQDAALVSALEEVMHTEVSARLAGRHGATPPAPQVDAAAPRSLFAVALDNAVEGCVRETFGALVARHQAMHARDGEVRASMARIAEDETRHAALSWKIDQWAQARLSGSEREVLQLAKQRAAAALREEAAAPVNPVLVSEAGLPSPEVAVALVDTLARELWA
ncbi:ferritin-like domain-containing protein [Corallococcus macrosporus]|uniref:ferritin-like domain-containing protein n=1 Tax=Corallococcus macrosporus TaxID=35 RepID=UPI00030FE6DB|nr:ferritin-like domain-containing protein [Corallococcus macrosporus]